MITKKKSFMAMMKMTTRMKNNIKGENIRYWFNPYIFQPYDKIEYKLSKFNGLFSKTRWAGYNRLVINGTTEIDKGE